MKSWIEISKDSLLHNLRAFTGHLDKETAVMAVVKANAYGHGLKEIVSLLKNRSRIVFGVDSFEEALLVRSVAPRKEVMILGFIPEENFMEAIKKGFHISAYSHEVIASLNNILRKKVAKPAQFKVHLKIETGTNRLGIKPAELKTAKLGFPVTGIYTHFADVENPASRFYKQQVRALNEALGILNKEGFAVRFVHSSCTAAILQHRALGGNLVRLGIGLYGLWPSPEMEDAFPKKLDLRPVLSWKARIAQVKRVARGETVGYGRTYKARAPTHIGILPVGYYDGYDRKLSNCGEVLVGGKRVKIAGRVCMNMIMIDLGNISAARREATLIGKDGNEEIKASDIAGKIGTINYEVVTRINPLLPRVVVQ